ncbi:amidohydrolase [Pedobacter puniceum]|uniref:Amidohydrolase n=1 Tax=Pedobacter puniceum TaxID=2666136 RepID=A0A7K0FLS1_9SPHI|nr:amidohydrolase [Pedobacter puniceum]MRX46908.1 amidohydrolase [Pedobacter puniceum]
MKLYLILLFCLFYKFTLGQDKALIKLKNQVSLEVDKNFISYKADAQQLYQYAELGYKEYRSSALLKNRLKTNGFKVDTVLQIPTAFVATYGTGKPVIAILAEYDALPGFSQEVSPYKSVKDSQSNGHACGHHLFGVGSVAAGLEIKKLIEQGKLKGTIKIYGCPAEEGGSGKVYLVRDGYFKDVDIAFHWHPASRNRVITTDALANISAKFRFKGVSSHASASPQKGRSALDGVEAMNYMVNMMREHIPQESRIHYVITDGGKAPNVVPDYAEVYYYVRHPDKENVKALFERIVSCAKGAALGTETAVEYEIIGGTHDLLINVSLAKLMYQNLEKVGGLTYTKEEFKFAQELSKSLQRELTVPEKIEAFSLAKESTNGSTDVGDVSYIVPTVGVNTATWIPGTSAHSWQAVACGGTDFAIRATSNAIKTLVYTAIDLYQNTKHIETAKIEFNKAIGSYQYKPLLGDRKPALNYRD